MRICGVSTTYCGSSACAALKCSEVCLTMSLTVVAGVPKEPMIKQCQSLVNSYNAAAQQASDLAKLHQQAAAASK